jgi:hypothetical protein
LEKEKSIQSRRKKQNKNIRRIAAAGSELIFSESCVHFIITEKFLKRAWEKLFSKSFSQNKKRRGKYENTAVLRIFVSGENREWVKGFEQSAI